jgi:hypothetical protein
MSMRRQRTERQRNYGPGNRAILEALEQNRRDQHRALPVFMQRAAQDPIIIEEALRPYWWCQAQFVDDEMDEVDEVA